MKPIIISPKRQRIELIFMIIAFLISFCFNIYAIILFNAPWSELWTQLFRVIFLSAVIYLLTLILRLIYIFFYYLWTTYLNKNKIK